MNPDTQDLIDVVVIGAGASGLRCASNLLRDGGNKVSIKVLEARDRIGGRIHTVTESKTDLNSHGEVSFPRDLGAAWVHGTGLTLEDEQNPMLKLLEKATPPGESVVEYHLSPVFEGNAWTRPDTVLHKPGRIALYRNGQRIQNNSPDVIKSIQKHYQIEREIAEQANHLYETGQGMQTVLTSIAQARAMVAGSLGPVEHHHDSGDNDSTSVEADLVPFYSFLFENWNGLSETDLQWSFLNLPERPMTTDEHYVDEGDYEGPHCKLKHGMKYVLEPLYMDVIDHLCLNEQVAKITRIDPRHLRIETTSGTIIESKCCISTIPLGCLQKHHSNLFQPELDVETTEAIQSISAGFYKKVFLTFDSIFWPTDEPLLGLIRSVDRADQLGKYLLVYNFWAKDSIPCIEACLCGNNGKWAYGKTDEEIRDTVIKFLEDSLGVNLLASKCLACHVTRWEEDPLTLGTYSSFHLGTLERHVDKLQEAHWDGDLIFAGEFTESGDMGSVQAALMSGDRAATMALQTLLSQESSLLLQ